MIDFLAAYGLLFLAGLIGGLAALELHQFHGRRHRKQIRATLEHQLQIMADWFNARNAGDYSSADQHEAHLRDHGIEIREIYGQGGNDE